MSERLTLTDAWLDEMTPFAKDSYSITLTGESVHALVTELRERRARDTSLLSALLSDRDALAERVRVLEASRDAERAVVIGECREHVELNGHIDVAEQCADWIADLPDDGSGKLQDYVSSLRIVIEQFDKQRRRANWHEAGYEAGKQKIIEYAVHKATADLRTQLSTAVRERDEARRDMEAAEQRLVAVMDGTFSVGDGTAQKEIERLRVEVTALAGELDRHRHGNTIEGDFVCPNELEVANLRRLQHAAKAWAKSRDHIAINLWSGREIDLMHALATHDGEQPQAAAPESVHPSNLSTVIEVLEDQLTSLTAARDELAEIATRYIGASMPIREADAVHARVAELRKVGK